MVMLCGRFPLDARDHQASVLKLRVRPEKGARLRDRSHINIETGVCEVFPVINV
jgi:hypothetical protein